MSNTLQDVLFERRQCLRWREVGFATLAEALPERPVGEGDEINRGELT